jgi:hypothetical protein
MRNAEIPIKQYSIVQTGPKTQLGGEKEGLFKKIYHVEIAVMVKGVLTIPTNSHPTTETISLGKFFMNIV